MKTKVAFSIIIAAIVITAMVIFKDKMTLTEILTTFVGSGGVIIAIWQWFSTEEIKVKNSYLQKQVRDDAFRINSLREQNVALFEKVYDVENPKASDEEL